MSIFTKGVTFILLLALAASVHASEWFGFDGNDEADPSLVFGVAEASG